MEPGTRVLVTGAGGQVGRALRRHLPAARFLRRDDLDVRDGPAVAAIVEGARAVVHLAAMTDVDGCEREPALANAINAEGTRNVAAAATAQGARVVYLSTDYVFDGSKEGPYREDDEPRPLNVYGATKLAGEGYVGAGSDNLVVRTSWVFGDGHNFIRTMRRLGRERDRIAVVDDQFGRPTSAFDLAEAIAHLLDRGATGIVHVTGSGPPTTWARLAERVLELDGLPAKIERVSTERYATAASSPPAPRPRNSVLGMDLLEQRWGFEMPPWERAVADYMGISA